MNYSGLRPTIAKVIEELSKEIKTVRDPVHGDIVWNRLETSVIDTETFQRLRRIKQLGTAHLVFPGAEHSRFSHSVGTLFIAQTLLHNIHNVDFSERVPIGDYMQNQAFDMIVRLSALLHDVQEFPLSHTLEKEGNLFPDQWKNNTFNKKIFGGGTEIYNAIYGLVLSSLSPKETGETIDGQTVLKPQEKEELANSITRTIICYTYCEILGGQKAPKEISKDLFKTGDIIDYLLDNRYLIAGSQIVSDTVCSDLLDYLPRDFYLCGIKKTYDERFLKYAIIGELIDDKTKKRHPVFAYNLMGKRDELKNSVLSSLFDTLELRYTIAEVVHTHKTKNAFSAMVIEAFNHYYQSLKQEELRKFEDDLMNFGDDELLSYLRNSNPISKYILDYYFKRRPYHGCVILTYKSIEDKEVEKNFNEHVQKAKERLYLEKLLVELTNCDPAITEPLRDGDILLYAMPNPERLFKELETNVKYKVKQKEAKIGTLLSLTETPADFGSTSRAMKSIIQRTALQRRLLVEKFKNMWNVSLFLSPDLNYEKIQPIVTKLIEQFLLQVKCEIKIDAEYDVPKLLSPEIHEKLWKLTKDKRSFGSFEEMYNSIREMSSDQ